MDIDYQNRNVLDDIYIHDSEFAGYTYDYQKREVRLNCRNIFSRRSITFVFQNVILLKLQSCTFWNVGNSILWLELKDSCELVEQIIEDQHITSDLYEGSFLNKGNDYLAVEFTINSGDTLLIVCQCISYSETPLIG